MGNAKRGISLAGEEAVLTDRGAAILKIIDDNGD